jgi:hypothetical protein
MLNVFMLSVVMLSIVLPILIKLLHSINLLGTLLFNDQGKRCKNAMQK